jgi:hypothetical protein
MIDAIDAALIDFFSRVQWGGKAVPVVFSSPDKAFGALSYLIAKRTGKAIDDKPYPIVIRDAAEHLPFISVQRDALSFDTSRFQSHPIRNFKPDADSGICYTGAALRPMLSSVNVELWCKERRQASYVQMQLEEQFLAEEATLYVDFVNDVKYDHDYGHLLYAKNFPVVPIQLAMTGVSDSSDLEMGEAARYIRMSFSYELKVMLPRPIRPIPIMREATVTISDTETQEDYGTIAVLEPEQE